MNLGTTGHEGGAGAERARSARGSAFDPSPRPVTRGESTPPTSGDYSSESCATIAALFCRADSHYKQMPAVDAYDEARDALTWPGGVPGIFHPPCRAWARLKGMAKPRPGERELALWSMSMVRRFGGVLEHPVASDLWKETGCRTVGIRDDHGGILITVNQGDFGHGATKATGLYLVGTPVPELPFYLRPPVNTVENMGRAERERTPAPFAALLVHLALAAA